eukprot:scaffold25645_cov206-Cylindrotheca_fusiformis.AAC.3
MASIIFDVIYHSAHKDTTTYFHAADVPCRTDSSFCRQLSFCPRSRVCRRVSLSFCAELSETSDSLRTENCHTSLHFISTRIGVYHLLSHLVFTPHVQSCLNFKALNEHGHDGIFRTIIQQGDCSYSILLCSILSRAQCCSNL